MVGAIRGLCDDGYVIVHLHRTDVTFVRREA